MTPAPTLLLLMLATPGPVADVTAYSDHLKPMASGRRVYVGACAGPRWVPLGTRVRIAGRVYVVEDRTARRFDGRYDLFMWSRKACLKWGKRKMEVTILKFGKTTRRHQ